MITDYILPPSPVQIPSACFLFDAHVNLVDGPAAADWPVAVLTALRSCVCRALADGRYSFAPLGLGPKWHIVSVSRDGWDGFAVFADAAA